MTLNRRPGRLLLAEDDTEMRRMLTSILMEDGFEVVEAANGPELLSHIATTYPADDPQKAFDVIISDVRMPGFTGLEVLSGLKDVEGAPPIIFITAFGDEGIHKAARDLGAAIVLDKPFDMDDLLAATASLTCG